VFYNPLKVPPQRQARQKLTNPFSKKDDQCAWFSDNEADVIGVVILQPFREPERRAVWKNNFY